MNFIIEIDDERGTKVRKLYITNWGVSVWKIHAKIYDKIEDANKSLNDYLNKTEFKNGRELSHEG